jgi:hypothetical protein
MLSTVVAAFAALAACGDGSAPASNRDATCKSRAAELTAYLTQVFDPNAKPAPPWDALDADTRAKADRARDKLRAAMAKTSADEASPLSTGFQPGPMDETIAGCAQANAVYPHAAEYQGPGHMTKYAIALGDGVAACDCHLNIPIVRAGFYMMFRGPD